MQDFGRTPATALRMSMVTRAGFGGASFSRTSRQLARNSSRRCFNTRFPLASHRPSQRLYFIRDAANRAATIEQPNRSPIAARSSRRPETGLRCSLRNLANCCALHAQAPISGRGCRTFQQLFKSFLITALTFVSSSITCHCGVATYIR